MSLSTTTIRVSLKTRDSLQELARRSGVSMQEVVDQALDLYRRQQLLSATNAAYAALHADSDAWQRLQAERAEWDAALNDGLEQY
jgi:predicted transcriptional regulator